MTSTQEIGPSYTESIKETEIGKLMVTEFVSLDGVCSRIRAGPRHWTFEYDRRRDDHRRRERRARVMTLRNSSLAIDRRAIAPRGSEGRLPASPRRRLAS